MKLTTDKFCKSSDYLLRGDILCTPVSGHTVVVLSDGAKSSTDTDTIPEENEGGFTVKMQTLKRGAKGDQVKALQALLIGYGYDCGKFGADGDFGGATESAVRKYQSRNGLNTDGVVGAKTWAKLLGCT